MSTAAADDLLWLTDSTPDELFDALALLEPEEADDAIWLRCQRDLALFGAVFFGERLPLPYNAFHRDVLARPKTPWAERGRSVRYADAAPRGNAKSTLETYISLIHDAVYGYEAFVGILSTTFDLSQDLVKDLHAAFSEPELHPDFHEAFGPFQVLGSATDFTVFTPGQDARGCRFKAFSFGGTVRGVKHAGIRPTKWVIDDGEHPEKVRSPDQRQKTWDFLTKDVLKSGDKFTIYRIVGTVLHPDSMLNRVIGCASGEYGLGWQGKRWQSVISWPERSDLWQQCRELWADLTDPEREDTARRFYERNRAEMDRGAEVLWEEKEDLFDLHVMLWTDGPASFNSEKQNVATDPERQVFYPERWRRCSHDGITITTSKGRRVRLSDCKIAIWLDPRASEETERRDFAALAVVARDKHGYGYVLSCDMRRDNTSAQIDRLWGAFDIWQNRAVYGYEDNGFQVMMGKEFDRIRAERREAGRSWNCTLQGYTSTTNKHDRICSLAPRLDNGWIEVADTVPQPVIEQARQVPTGTHDDGWDAIERAFWLIDGRPTARLGSR